MAKRVTIQTKPAKRRAVTADEWVTGGSAAPAETAEAPAADKPKLAKVTMYVRPEQIADVEEIQIKERKRTGRKPDKSDLFQEALDLLIEKYNSKK